MTIDLLWIDFYPKDKIFGVGLFCLHNQEIDYVRNLLSIHYNDRIWTFGFLFMNFEFYL